VLTVLPDIVSPIWDPDHGLKSIVTIAMWPLSKQRSYPGVQQHPDGTITFSLTEEEAREADLALNAFEGLLIHPEAAERIRNGTIAAALSRYAKNLVSAHCIDISKSEYMANRSIIEKMIEKAVAAEWKASSLCPLPIFLYHRASFLQMLGMRKEAKELFVSFVRQQAAFKMDHVDTVLCNYEGTDIDHALSHANREV
jgi:hypothetical protein